VAAALAGGGMAEAAGGAAAVQDVNPPSIHSNRGAWPIRRQWTVAETQHYAQWVENIFDFKTKKGDVEQRIAKLEKVIYDPQMNLLEQPDFLGQGGNPQLPRNIVRTIHSMIDCAKFTAFMPAYYAYRRGLPWMFSYVWSDKGEVRTAPYNIPSGYVTCLDHDLYSFFVDGIMGYSSGNYRVNINGKNSEWSDTVPVAINRQYLMPGCVNYTDGHCLLLAKCTEYGELYFLNCSTTDSRDIFTYNGLNTVAGITPRGSDTGNEWNCCYQGLRVFRYPIAELGPGGEVTRVRRRTDMEMKEFGFSTEEYDIVQQITEKHYIQEGDLRPQGFHDLIRLRMKTVDKIVPLKFMEQYVDELLEVYRIREDFIQEAWQEVKQSGPIVYPEDLDKENIFQALGRWETWSSPSSDVDRRNKYFYLADWLEYAIRWYGMQPATVDLTGLEKYEIHSQADLARAFIEEKKRLFPARTMAYTNSKGEKVPLTLNDIEERLYALSFDPNHPPELRWGAPEGSPERATAQQTYTPLPDGLKMPMEEAYKKQIYYRTVCQRETTSSYLRRMFTEGFPVRDKLEQQLAKWLVFVERVDGTQEKPVEKVPILVPHVRTKEEMDAARPRSMRPARQGVR